MEKHPIIIGGKQVVTEKAITVRYPYDGTVLYQVSTADRNAIDLALEAARRSFAVTKKLSIRDRIEILDKMRELLVQRTDEFAKIIVHECGKTISEARGEVSRAQETLRLSAIAAQEEMGEILPVDAAPNGEGKWGFYQRFPVGPTVAITPFNFPLNLAMHKIAPAIAVGNPFLLKPASATPLTGIKLGELAIEAGYPASAVNVLVGSGALVGEPLVKDPRVRCVTFTGSPDIGRRIAVMAGAKRLALELGSTSGVIVLPDADIMRAISRIALGAYAVAGQVCISVQRVYVHQKTYNDFIELLLLAIEQEQLGDPMDEMTDVGPMITEVDARRVEDWVESSDGRVLTGGKRRGTLFEPTVVENPSHGSPLIQKEVFGPVVSVVKVKSFHEALRLMESTPYGLQAGIFTSDIHYAREAFDYLTLGGVTVNDVPTFRADLQPYGGEKLSGLEREGPRFAIHHMTYPKSFIVHRRENG